MYYVDFMFFLEKPKKIGNIFFKKSIMNLRKHSANPVFQNP